MKISKDYNLKELNTFGISAQAKFFVEVVSEDNLVELFGLPEFKNNQKIFLGRGSNVLFTKDFKGIVILNRLKGIEITEEGSENVKVRAWGGEFWQDLVVFAVLHGFWGVENLALIPGTVGAAPIQNIGAYGAEVKDTLENVEVFDIETGEKKILNKEECALGYRESVFKNKFKGKYFITAVTFKLSKTPKPNLSYKILADFLKKNNIEVKKPKDVSDAISDIRRSKLPDPKVIGSAGSFFKNVVVPLPRLRELLQAYPNLPYFTEDQGVKIPAGWLVEQCGPSQGGTSWKGYREGNVGVHEKQALVLVNYGGATGAEVLGLANKIILSVKEKFGLDLVPEVNIV
jgi:UDP-N-acetylmuramate dehydrogenase